MSLRMRIWILTFGLLLPLSSQASKFQDACYWVMLQGQKLKTKFDQPFLHERGNDVLLNISNDEETNYRNISLKEMLANDSKVDLIRKNSWLAKYWKFFWLLPEVVWSQHTDASGPMVIGVGTSEIGDVEVRLLKNSETFSIEMVHRSERSAEAVRRLIHLSADYTKRWAPYFSATVTPVPGQARTVMTLTNLAGYQANNAFFQRLIEYSLGLSSPDQPSATVQ